jgi:hypothetical protein
MPPKRSEALKATRNTKNLQQRNLHGEISMPAAVSSLSAARIVPVAQPLLPASLPDPTPEWAKGGDGSLEKPLWLDPKVKQRYSWVFKHMPHDDMYTLYYNDDGEEVWRCRYCANAKLYKISGSTSGPSGHLTDYHGIPGGSARDVQAKNVQRSLEQGFATARANPQKRRRPDTETIEQDRLEALWVRCVVSCNLSFRLVANTEFRAFVKYLNEDAESLLAASHTDVRRWVLRQFDGIKGNITIVISKAKSKIHISCDLWTSPNSIAILGITAQFIDIEGQLRSLVLALKEVNGDHTGENLSKYVMEVIRDYDIQGNLGYFVMDNAENNDTMITSLSHSLRREFRLHYDPKHFRLRCQGHIINLAVKSFLFVTDEENIEEDEETNIMLVTLKEIEEWAKRDLLGSFITSSFS